MATASNTSNHALKAKSRLNQTKPVPPPSLPHSSLSTSSSSSQFDQFKAIESKKRLLSSFSMPHKKPQLMAFLNSSPYHSQTFSDEIVVEGSVSIDYEIPESVLSKLDLLSNDLMNLDYPSRDFSQFAADSLIGDIACAVDSVRNPKQNSSFLADLVLDLGTRVGVLLLRCVYMGVPVEIREKIEGLIGDLMSLESLESCQNFRVIDVMVQIKCGSNQEFRFALLGLILLIRGGVIREELIEEEGIVQILLNRLGSSKQSERLTIIVILRCLVFESVQYKEKMTEPRHLSILVRSLTRDVGERREAVGLLSDLLEVPGVRRRIGRIQGCIVMLVSLLNGDDVLASRDARNVLCALSSNTQDVLHMAEAGYFKPLVKQLKEGSDMSKILMATALSKMELTDQSRTVLGDEGSMEPLIKMITSGKLEAKLSALGALQNLSSLTKNVRLLVNLGIIEPLLQLLFSVTSVLMTLQEPASAILASIAKSESVLVNQAVVQHMLSLLSLSSPAVQYHLLCALNSMTSHSNASKIRVKLKENDAIQLLLPFLTESKVKVRTIALHLLYNLSLDISEDFSEQLGETYLDIIVNIISASTSEDEKTAAVGILNNLPVSDKKATDILKKAHLLPILVSMLGSSTINLTTTSNLLIENITGVLIRFTVPWDKKLQQLSAEHGVISQLVKVLSTGSPIAMSRAATSLAQLSQNSLSLSKSRPSRWLCAAPANSHCEVHGGHCSIKGSFCLVKAGAISPLIQILEGKVRDADEAVLSALATVLHDEIWECGSNAIARASGVAAILRVLAVGNVKAQQKALWMLERIFRVDALKVEFGESAQVLLIDLAQKGDISLKSTSAMIMAQLELLQMQSSYF
ncbi:hypothetical protein Scep_003878 [Stephania cephalantha]|uniref:Uncharacterized protein n=1 Tax=Stephania cephalantha TaxID=152367 RepID=A0AAP0KU54_9MAGN